MKTFLALIIILFSISSLSFAQDEKQITTNDQSIQLFRDINEEDKGQIKTNKQFMEAIKEINRVISEYKKAEDKESFDLDKYEDDFDLITQSRLTNAQLNQLIEGDTALGIFSAVMQSDDMPQKRQVELFNLAMALDKTNPTILATFIEECLSSSPSDD